MVEITPFVDEGLGNSSYLVEVGDRRALVIDPPRDVVPFQVWAQSHGLTLSHAVETHLHADFVSGSRELAQTGATIVAPRSARLAFPHTGLVDGDELDLGGLTLEAIATPGHAPEHLGYLLLDGSRRIALFSGGALLPGAVARTDLIAPERTEHLARALYRALHERVLTLPDDLPIYPTHGAGSFCAAPGTNERTTTIGRERATNPLLAAPDEDEFVRRLLAAFGTYPAYFGRLREVNRKGPRVYGGLPALRALDVDEVAQRIEGGAELLDVRPLEAFGTAHIPRSLSIALRPVFASWLGWLVSADRPLVFVVDPEQDRRDLVRQALGIGYERLEGELAGGIDAWHASGRPLASTELVWSPDARRDRIVDVRQASEYAAGHVPGALNVELGAIVTSGGELPGRVTFMCGHGERAMSAASLAERTGQNARVLVGSAAEWARSHGRALALGR